MLDLLRQLRAQHRAGRRQGRARALTPGTFRPDFAKIQRCHHAAHRAIINSPYNPSATIWTADEMRQLEALLAPTDILLISDGGLRNMVFDGAEHQSAARFAGLAARVHRRPALARPSTSQAGKWAPWQRLQH